MRTVGILLFDEVEVLDFAGPFEVFSLVENGEDAAHFKVVTIAEWQAPITAKNGLTVIPSHDIHNHPPLDVLVIPGGHGAKYIEINNPVVIEWITQQTQVVELVLSVCTGAFLLAEAGLLNGRTVTTHWRELEHLAEKYPALEVIEHDRFIDASDDALNIVTSAGISAGIAASLYCVQKLIDRPTMLRVAKRMEFATS